MPMFVDSVWDANDDEHSCGISYRKMFYEEKNRVSVELSLVVNNDENSLLLIYNALITFGFIF